ncbi:hypothetical protein, partial [Chromatium okenii]
MLAHQKIIALLLFSASTAVIAATAPFDFSGKVSGGYDSNPAQTNVNQGFAFVHTDLDAAYHASDALTVGINGWNRDFTANNLMSRLTLYSDWAHDIAQGLGLLTVSLAAAAYRDRIVPADERDEMALMLRYDHILDARNNLSISGELRQLAYQQAALPWAGRPGSDPREHEMRERNPIKPLEIMQNGADASGRTDWQTATRLDLTHYWSPTRSSVLTVSIDRCASPIATEAFMRHNIGGVLRWEPRPKWSLEFNFDWSRLRYDAAPQQHERIDLQRGLGIELRRRIDLNSAWFCRS